MPYQNEEWFCSKCHRQIEGGEAEAFFHQQDCNLPTIEEELKQIANRLDLASFDLNDGLIGDIAKEILAIKLIVTE